MPRTAEEIQADIDAAKAAGLDGRSARVKELKAELKGATTLPREQKVLTAADADADLAGTPRPDNPSVPAPVVPAISTSAGLPGASAYETDEWRFIENAIAEAEIDLKGASATGIVKATYNVVDAKLKVWRMCREIVAQVGIGNEWPQFSALGRNDRTGAKVEPKPAPPPPPAVPAAPPAAPTRSAGAEAMIGASMGADDSAARAAAIKAQMASMLGSRPAPARETAGAVA